jgi:galactokinase
MILELIQQFNAYFKHHTVPHVYFSPGSLNLMGEHTDYNKGHVLPVATTLGTYAIVHEREDKKVRLYLQDTDQYKEYTLDALHYHPNDGALNYAKGILYVLQKAGHLIDHGFDVLFLSHTPHQTGLSTSASIEMVTAVFVNELFGLTLSQLDLVKVCKKVENNYIGINSGVMDAYTIGFGKAGHALFLNCRHLDAEYIPLPVKDHALLLMHTDNDHRKMEVTYNRRRNECELALRDLQPRLQINHLCDLTMETFANAKHLIESTTLKKRVKHVVSENERTKQAAAFLRTGDLKALGTLFNASHFSLQNDFGIMEVELASLVRALQGQTGVLGAKMTGCCFGGCVIALVERDYVRQVQNQVRHLHKLATNHHVFFDEIILTDGAHQVTEGTSHY